MKEEVTYGCFTSAGRQDFRLCRFAVGGRFTVVTSHALLRYNERLGLGLESLKDIGIQFMLRNPTTAGITTTPPGFIQVIKDGVMFGKRDEDGIDIIRTFLAPEQLKSGQHDLSQAAVKDLRDSITMAAFHGEDEHREVLEEIFNGIN